MENIIYQLLPFVKGYLMLYIISFAVSLIVIIGILVVTLGLIAKENIEFNKSWNKHRR